MGTLINLNHSDMNRKCYITNPWIWLTMLIFLIPATSWSQATQMGADIDGVATGDNFGRAVSMPDGNTVAVGARNHDANGDSNTGQVRVFTYNGTTWNQKEDLDGLMDSDRFGASVSMPDANTVAAGAIDSDDNGSSSGHVRIFSWNGGSWVQKVQRSLVNPTLTYWGMR